MDVLLTRFKRQLSLVYSDNVVIFLQTEDEHIEHGRKIMMLLYDVGLTMNLKKRQYFSILIGFLGHVTRPGRLEVVTGMTEGIHRPEFLTSMSELWSFLGLCNVICRVATLLSNKRCASAPQTFDRLANVESTAL